MRARIERVGLYCVAVAVAGCRFSYGSSERSMVSGGGGTGGGGGSGNDSQRDGSAGNAGRTQVLAAGGARSSIGVGGGAVGTSSAGTTGNESGAGSGAVGLIGTSTGGTTAGSGVGGRVTLGGNAGASAGSNGFSSGESGASTGGTAGAGGVFAVGGATTSAGASPASSSGGTAGTSSSGGMAAAGAYTAGRCDWSQGSPQFGAAITLGAPNTSYPEIDPVLSRDGLTLYFVSYRDNKNGNDIYYSTRTSATASFGAATVLTQANSAASETHFFVSANGLEAYVASDRSSAGSPDIFYATRATTSGSWSPFTALSSINSSGADFDPHLESDGLTLWFDPIGRSDGSGQQDIFWARRRDLTSPFGSPVPGDNLNTAANEWNVSLTNDGLVIVFQSDRDGLARVYFAVRNSRSAVFGAPSAIALFDQYLPSLSDPFVSPDGCSILFAATLPTGLGAADLYTVEAAPQ